MNTTSVGAFVKSKSFIVLITTVAVLAVFAGSFSMGMTVGYHKARNSYAWGENYHRTFAGPRDGFMKGIARDFDGRDFMESGGAFGIVLKIESQSLIISGRDGRERVVAILPDTVIRKYRDDMTLGGIAVHDAIVVVGESDPRGVIQAQLIRLMPTPPTSPGGPMPSVSIQPR